VLDADELSQMMLALEEQGAENINFVTPTHIIPQIIEALVIAAQKGLEVPLVYNCGGYESPETLKMIEGVFDIYMPDAKYSKSEYAEKFSRARDYWHICRSSLKEMHRQVGDLVIEGGVAKRGLLIRHLVLPFDVAGSEDILDFIRNELSADTYVNIMQQYYPCYEAHGYTELSRRITFEEYKSVLEYARKIGLHRGM
jgi:putative pyruvate formate lyase activating enzyme